MIYVIKKTETEGVMGEVENIYLFENESLRDKAFSMFFKKAEEYQYPKKLTCTNNSIMFCHSEKFSVSLEKLSLPLLTEDDEFKLNYNKSINI